MSGPTRLTLTDAGLEYSVWFDRWDALQPNRARWHYRITDDRRGDVYATGDDLTTVPTGGGDLDHAEALASLLTFLSAAVDSHDHERRTGRRGENADLFPGFPYDEIGLDSDHYAMLATTVGGEF